MLKTRTHPGPSRWRPRAAALFGLALLASTACRGPAVQEEPRPEPGAPQNPRVREGPQFRSTEPLTLRRPDGKIIFYPVESGRAEDLARTILPIVQAEYGPEARVVPHVETNQLMIFIPDRRAGDASRRSPSRQ